jgi:hypothetical protein
MPEFDEDRILKITVRMTVAPLDMHAIDLYPAGHGSDQWALRVSSIDYLGRPGYTIEGPPEAPRFPSRTGQVTLERIEPILRRLRGLVLPASPPGTGGLDGECFSIRFRRALSHAQYQWWGWVPDAWAPLGDIVDDILDLADEPGWPRARRPNGPVSPP